MKMTTAAKKLAQRGYVNVNTGGSMPVFTKLGQKGSWMCGHAVVLTPTGMLQFRGAVCMHETAREVVGGGGELATWTEEESTGWDEEEIYDEKVGYIPLYVVDDVFTIRDEDESWSVHGSDENAIITEGFWDEAANDTEDEVGGRKSRARRKRRKLRRRARRAAARARRKKRRAKRRAKLRALRKRVKRRIHKVTRRLAKSKVLKGLRKGWSKMLQSPIAQGAIKAGAKALSAFGVPASATRAALTHMKNNAIERMKKGGLPAMLARASHKDAKRGSFFKELGKRQLKILPATLMAALPGGLGGKLGGKLAGKMGGKLVSQLSTKARKRIMAKLGKGKALQAIFRKLSKRKLLVLARNLGGGKLGKRQILALAKKMRAGKIGIKALRTLAKLRKTRLTAAHLAKAVRRRKKKRSLSPASRLRRAKLKKLLRTKKGRKLLRLCLNPKGKKRLLLSQALPKMRAA